MYLDSYSFSYGKRITLCGDEKGLQIDKDGNTIEVTVDELAEIVRTAKFIGLDIDNF